MLQLRYFDRQTAKTLDLENKVGWVITFLPFRSVAGFDEPLLKQISCWFFDTLERHC